jgi:hypothetical protein
VSESAAGYRNELLLCLALEEYMISLECAYWYSECLSEMERVNSSSSSIR